MENIEAVLPCRDISQSSSGGACVKPYKPILLVEDEHINQKIISVYLTQLGYAFDVVWNGLEALQALKTCRYGIVLMDIMMPVMDGLEAVSIIRDTGSDVLDHEVAVIAMSSGCVENRRDILAKGMNGCLSKSVSVSQLKAVLADWLTGPAGGHENVGNGLPLQYATILADDEVLSMFVAKAPEYLLAVKICLVGGNAAGAQYHAHKLAGAAAAVGAVRLAKHAAEMELLAGSTDMLAVAHGQQLLAEELDSLLAALAVRNQSE